MKVLGIFCIFLLASVANAASFNCAKASTAHEKFICAIPALSEADSEMGKAYKAATAFTKADWLSRDQRLFNLTYRSCYSDGRSVSENTQECLAALEERTALLKNITNFTRYYDEDLSILVARVDGGLIFHVTGAELFTMTHAWYCYGDTFLTAAEVDKVVKFKPDGLEVLESQDGGKTINTCYGMVNVIPGFYKKL